MQSNSHPQLNDFWLLSIFPHVHTSLTIQPLEYESQEVFEDQFQKILGFIFLLWPKANYATSFHICLKIAIVIRSPKSGPL